MSKRPTHSNRRHAGNGSLLGVFNPKSRSTPLLPKLLGFLVVVLIFVYFFRRSGENGVKQPLSKIEGDFTCTSEVQRAIPILKTTYNMNKVLHVGPDTCSVVSKLLKEEEETEAWGIEPYDIEDSARNCKILVRKGIVRVADIKFPLPYKENSFSLVIISDAVDYMSIKYLNKTIPELARVSSDGLVIFAGYPGHSRAKVQELSKFGRPAKMRSSSWWSQFFSQAKLNENQDARKTFEQSATKSSYKSGCQILHLKSNP
ncbi:hypothetical protein RD792_001195 [Penstemon davidsonii]|uniref:S-adenosyl-L-methionine-dependent methyltransferase n=1 Tax=Penstemon davidsonii TaxID=160366 RepID=A0ABR0DMR9_9LAMI|nr:hypothetical protein RD792_001195 [Penstemon davidsonii]